MKITVNGRQNINSNANRNPKANIEGRAKRPAPIEEDRFAESEPLDPPQVSNLDPECEVGVDEQDDIGIEDISEPVQATPPKTRRSKARPVPGSDDSALAVQHGRTQPRRRRSKEEIAADRKKMLEEKRKEMAQRNIERFVETDSEEKDTKSTKSRKKVKHSEKPERQKGHGTKHTNRRHKEKPAQVDPMMDDIQVDPDVPQELPRAGFNPVPFCVSVLFTAVGAAAGYLAVMLLIK